MKLGVFGAAGLLACAFSIPAGAATLSEDFEAPFPTWESGWFGTNSNAENCYGAGQGRGNNPDGLWISTTGQGCSGSPVSVAFNNAFASTLTSFSFDVAGYSPTTLTFFDATGNVLSSTAVTLTSGAFGDPGVYVNYGVTSSTGIGGFSFSGAAAGNTSIDNILAEVGGSVGGVPEPSAWALMILGFGLVGAGMRRRTVAVSFA